MNTVYTGSNFFEEVPTSEVVVVKIGLDEIMNIPFSPYKGTHSFLIDCHIRSKLREAGIPVSVLTDTIRGGEIEWWDDIEYGQRVFVWRDVIAKPKHQLYCKNP